MRVIARPTKLTDELTDRMEETIGGGSYAEVACQAVGISSSTYYRWMARGAQEPGSIYAAFRERVLRAEAEAEVHAVSVLRNAMMDDWRAALAYLERRHPLRWRTRNQTELVGRDGGPIQTANATIDLTKLTDEELAILEEMTTRASISQ